MDISTKTFKATSFIKNRSTIWDQVIHDCFSVLTNYVIEKPSSSQVRHYQLQDKDLGRVISDFVSTFLSYEDREVVNFGLSLLTASTFFGPILEEAVSFSADYTSSYVDPQDRLYKFLPILSLFSEVEAPKDATPLQQAFAYLLSNNRTEAAQCLASAGYPRLAMIIIQNISDAESSLESSSSGHGATSKYLQTLLNDFVQDEIDLDTVDSDLKRIYLLMVGDLDLLLSLNLSWSHILLLLLRNSSDPAEALEKFSAGVSSGKIEVPYFDQRLADAFTESHFNIYDSKFALLQMFIYRDNPEVFKEMITILSDPLAYTLDESNYIFPYIMIKILSQLLGFEMPKSLLKGLVATLLKENPDYIPLIYSLEELPDDDFLNSNSGSSIPIIEYCLKSPVHNRSVHAESTFALVDELIEKGCIEDAHKILVDDLIPLICTEFLFSDTIDALYEATNSLISQGKNGDRDLIIFNTIFEILRSENLDLEKLTASMTSAISLSPGISSECLIHYIADRIGDICCEQNISNSEIESTIREDAGSAAFWKSCRDPTKILQACSILTQSTSVNRAISKNLNNKL